MALLREGFSCSGIAEALRALGLFMSRNQIAGRVNRNAELKACRPDGPSKRTRKKPVANELNEKPLVIPKLTSPRVAPNDPLRIFTRAAEAKVIVAPPPPPEPKRVPRPVPRMMTLPDLKSHGRECRWPVSEDHSIIGHFLFCGAPTPEGKSYCLHHQEIAQPGGRHGQAQ
jgi:hypothetical protein